jgi:outer membrane biosynthesis protein TonB
MRALIVITILGLHVAHAQPAKLKPEAQQHLDASLKAYSTKDFDTALRELDLAYAADPAPALLYMKAQTLRLAGKCAQAIDIYKRYLELKLTAEQTTAAKTGIDTCEKQLAAEPKPVPKPEPKPEPKLEPKPEPKPEPAPPVAVAPAPIVAPPPAETPGPRPWYKNPVGDGLVVGGAIGIGVGAVFLAKASSSQTAATHAQLRSDFIADLDAATSQRRIGAVALGAGAALAIGGVIVFVLDRHADSHHIAATTDGHALYIAGSF